MVFVLSLAAMATLPMIFGWQGSLVQSGSMEPKISPGDAVLSTGLPADSVVPVGGVGEFDRPTADGSGTTTILHQIVYNNDDGHTPRPGDAYADVDTSPLTRALVALWFNGGFHWDGFFREGFAFCSVNKHIHGGTLQSLYE